MPSTRWVKLIPSQINPQALARERQRADEHIGGLSPRRLCELEPVC
jgi:hypothetical protein